MQRTLIVLGLLIALAGWLWPWLRKIGLGRLPGDLRIETENGVLYIPWVTCLALSVALSVVLWLLRR
jgi:Protein of unknown function (DUF2905)